MFLENIPGRRCISMVLLSHGRICIGVGVETVQRQPTRGLICSTISCLDRQGSVKSIRHFSTGGVTSFGSINFGFFPSLSSCLNTANGFSSNLTKRSMFASQCSHRRCKSSNPPISVDAVFSEGGRAKLCNKDLRRLLRSFQRFRLLVRSSQGFRLALPARDRMVRLHSQRCVRHAGISA